MDRISHTQKVGHSRCRPSAPYRRNPIRPRRSRINSSPRSGPARRIYARSMWPNVCTARPDFSCITDDQAECRRAGFRCTHRLTSARFWWPGPTQEPGRPRSGISSFSARTGRLPGSRFRACLGHRVARPIRTQPSTGSGSAFRHLRRAGQRRSRPPRRSAA